MSYNPFSQSCKSIEKAFLNRKANITTQTFYAVVKIKDKQDLNDPSKPVIIY